MQKSLFFRSPFFYLILSLSISDLLSALISPFALYKLTWGYDVWMWPDIFCKVKIKLITLPPKPHKITAKKLFERRRVVSKNSFQNTFYLSEYMRKQTTKKPNGRSQTRSGLIK